MKNAAKDTTLDRAELNARLLNTPLAHETKLNIIKEALETNTYYINSNRIAEGLLEYAKEPSKIEEIEFA
ncbi:MAG: flagellar biosynthesis anti-sigma factor FlgM [Legionella sp.]|jgi:anti-sigma28 factor (negative regulator of flagellin synthesis)|nr:flagellar biosynthesis anti-sigma factor FlgM [Legionella sp.]